jgi:hypothetical protein
LVRDLNIWSIERAAWEACSATWNLGSNSAFSLGLRKTTENLNRVGRWENYTESVNTLCGHFSPYLTGNTLRLHYRAQPVDAVWRNSRCLL